MKILQTNIFSFLSYEIVENRWKQRIVLLVLKEWIVYVNVRDLFVYLVIKCEEIKRIGILVIYYIKLNLSERYLYKCLS